MFEQVFHCSKDSFHSFSSVLFPVPAGPAVGREVPQERDHGDGKRSPLVTSHIHEQ